MTAKVKSNLLLKLLFITVSLAAAGIYCDIKQEGSWQKSNINRHLKNYKVYEHYDLIKNKLHDGLLYLDHSVNENFPSYRKMAIEFSEPYIELSRNLGTIFCNLGINIAEILHVKYPSIIASIDDYAHGVMEQSQNAVNTVWSSSIMYFNRRIDYLQKEVFVGQLSPENMQKIVYEALNATQNKASEYYYWLYDKVKSAVK